MAGAVLMLSGTACSSGQSGDRLTDLLEDDEVVAELRYDTTAIPDSAYSGSVQTVVLDVEVFVSEFVKSEEGWPSWLLIGESVVDSETRASEEDTHVALDWLRQYMRPEIQEGNGAYVWSLYWTLAMPPAQIQLAILEREFGAGDPVERDVAGFRTRYPEYLTELARAWLDVNSEHRPEWLRIE